MARRVVLAGGSGYLGRHLAQRLRARGDDVVVLTRGPSGERGGVRFAHWDGRTLGSWTAVLEGADALVNLAGRRVDVRPTRRNVDDLRRSRVDAVRTLGEAVAGLDAPPAVWVQIATMAIYGEGGEIVCDETVAPPPDGPRQMVGVAAAWEEAFAAVTRASGGRAVLLRCGVAIGPGDPATAHLAWLARLGLGGRIGSGRQWVSWVALDDLLDVVLRAIDEPAVTGTYHVTSPLPVRNAALMSGVRRAVGRRWGVAIPAFGVHVGTWLLGSDAALPLTGRRGHPGRLLAEGYRFIAPDLDTALGRALAR